MSDTTTFRVSDSQWRRIQTAIPRQPDYNLGGRPPTDDRKCFEGILWILSKGISWRRVPTCYGSRSAVRRRFFRWVSSGTWAAMVALFLEQLSPADRSYWSEVLENSIQTKTENKLLMTLMNLHGERLSPRVLAGRPTDVKGSGLTNR